MSSHNSRSDPGHESGGARLRFRLEALVDFIDDALATVITPDRIDSMMSTLKEQGIQRVSWGYYGDGHGGYLMPAGLSGRWRNYAHTVGALDNPLRAAAESAHRYGIELYAYFKPYETGLGAPLPDGSPEAREYGRVKQKGGWLPLADRFVVAHPDLRIRHKPDASGKDLSHAPVTGLKLVKRDDSPTRINREHLQIWSSRLNYRYQPCHVDVNVHEAVEPCVRDVHDVNGQLVTRKGDWVRTLTLSGFRLTDPYILVTTDFMTGPGDFENTGTELLTAFDADGTVIPGVFSTGRGIWEADRVDFRNWGLFFDVGFGHALVRLDKPNASGREGLIGFARGRNEFLPGALCEAEPQVREYWLSCVREMLDAGVDGIDFRVENHSTHTDYGDEYGFNEVVLAECARRGKADSEGVAQVRGEAYTSFLREAKSLIASHDKRMRINLNLDWFRATPPPDRRLAYPANIHYDWKGWVDQGLLDEAILRMYKLPFDTIFSDSVAEQMLARCEKNGIPVTVNRYINPDYPAQFERIRDDGRFSGFILYETANFLKFEEDGGPCRIRNDAVTEVCKMHAAMERTRALPQS